MKFPALTLLLFICLLPSSASAMEKTLIDLAQHVANIHVGLKATKDAEVVSSP